MQRVEVVIKGNAGEPMVLVFSAADTAELIAERLRTITFIVRQVDGQAIEPRRRTPRSDRETSTEVSPSVPQQ
ncbi:MAG: hypothetical protein ABI779_13530 [Acidobacteriota bacterium]